MRRNLSGAGRKSLIFIILFAFQLGLGFVGPIHDPGPAMRKWVGTKPPPPCRHRGALLRRQARQQCKIDAMNTVTHGGRLPPSPQNERKRKRRKRNTRRREELSREATVDPRSSGDGFCLGGGVPSALYHPQDSQPNSNHTRMQTRNTHTLARKKFNKTHIYNNDATQQINKTRIYRKERNYINLNKIMMIQISSLTSKNKMV